MDLPDRAYVFREDNSAAVAHLWRRRFVAFKQRLRAWYGDGVMRVEINLNEHTVETVVFTSIVLAIMAAVLAVIFYHVNNTNLFVRGNYCETTYNKAWVKCDSLKSSVKFDQP